jgi:excisionase family DNA binding protein
MWSINSTKNKENLPELIGLKEACEILKVHPNTLRQWDKKGILKAIRFGVRKDRRYRKEDIQNLLNEER